MAVIAMTREMATRGKDVSAGLAERLGLTIVHHEIVEHDIAERAGLAESQVHRLLEGEATLLERWKIDSRRLSRYTSEEVLELAARGNVLIRGWGATFLLKDVPHVVCVRVCAPMAFRERELTRRLGVDDIALARREIIRNDAAHNGVMQKLFGIDWTDASLYSLVLNTERVPVSQCVDIIARLSENPSFAETEASHQALVDRLIEVRIRRLLQQRFGDGALSPSITAAVAAGHVTLSGGVSDEHLIVEAIRLTHSVHGVKGVDSRIALVGFYPPGGY